MPIYADGTELVVTWVKCHVVDSIQHHGQAVDSGHYTMVQVDSETDAEQSLRSLMMEKVHAGSRQAHVLNCNATCKS